MDAKNNGTDEFFDVMSFSRCDGDSKKFIWGFIIVSTGNGHDGTCLDQIISVGCAHQIFSSGFSFFNFGTDVDTEFTAPI